jgi:hypothetical protein
VDLKRGFMTSGFGSKAQRKRPDWETDCSENYLLLNCIITPTLVSELRARNGVPLRQACGLTVLNRSVFSRGRYHLNTEGVVVVGIKVTPDVSPS